MKTRMSPAGNRNGDRGQRRDSGFTLFEVLAVMVVIAIATAAVSVLYRSQSQGIQVKTAALLAASRLRDLRSNAMTSGTERVATIDVAEHIMRFSDGRAPLKFGTSINLAVTAADSERRGPSTAGVRFYPNGSSTGASIDLKTKGQAYEIRVNWLTGRVSTSATD